LPRLSSFMQLDSPAERVTVLILLDMQHGTPPRILILANAKRTGDRAGVLNSLVSGGSYV